ncbi:unnamed protein product [Nippostrongylus brasiliensis]|uniref:ZP domain-containing protein n=1 Tax=Nippostrongylus brasiliensis TaxID=27835 RepID=A0A0N4Y546_NIPBR|nr:unnamed protein product [Nippostrongylus brasiliensis]
MCRTLLEDEMCERTMPIMKGFYPITKIDDRLVLRIKPDRTRGKRFALSTTYLPYNCHVLKSNETMTQDDAFVWQGCPSKAGVAIYQSKATTMVEFVLMNVLSGYRSQISGNYVVTCVIVECSRHHRSTTNRCPNYDHCEQGTQWIPALENVDVLRTPATIRMRFYPMYQSAHRH